MNSYTIHRLLSWIIPGAVLVLAACSAFGYNGFNQDGTRLQLSTTEAVNHTSSIPNSMFTLYPLLTTTKSLAGTIMPTLSSNEAKSLVLDLLQGNGGCRLPCWWSITPGTTTWYEAERFLSRFADGISIEDQEDGHKVAYVRLPSPVDVPYIPYLEQTYGIQDGVVETIRTYNYELADWYYLPNILNTYGKPDEVGISTFANELMDSLPFSLSLFYLNQGILIEYAGYRDIKGAGEQGIIGDKVRVCPQGGTYNFLYLWSPTNRMTYDDAIRNFLDIQDMPYPLPLIEATGMNVGTFYETFKNPNTTTCLETPTDLWPVY